MVRRVLTVLCCLLLFAFPAQAAREVILHTDALRVEQVEESQVLLLPEFTAELDEYTLGGASGRFERATEAMEAKGSSERRATLTRAGDDAFSVSASRRIYLTFEDEFLQAEGDVHYSSQETEATSETLIVDRRDTVRTLVDALIARMPQSDTRTLILDFFADLTEDDRLILLQGDVHVEREDSTMDAAWAVFNESKQDEFISVADEKQGLRLKLVIEEEEDEAE